MTIDQAATEDATEEPQVTAVKPKLWFDTVTFSGGDSLSFDEDDIVVFVGPNNAGKSAVLREMQSLVSTTESGVVVKSATFQSSGTDADFRAYLEEKSIRRSSGSDLSYSGFGYNINNRHVSIENPAMRRFISAFFCTRIATETRIMASNGAGAIALHQVPPEHPIHLLLMDDKLAVKISNLFRHAFGVDLTAFRAGGGQFPLFVGEKPVLAAGEDELSKSFVNRLRASSRPLDQQGDGMRSFATVLLYALAEDSHSIQFLDEPEAFLHPPQARLIGEFIARERRAKSQLFIATHSTDILEGLIAGGGDKIRIVRIHRDDDVNKIKELSKEKTAAIATDTLARYSGVFSGIFYQHVVICESDADCLFYSSILHTKAVSGDRRADVLFIHTSGKHRMAQLAETLRDLDVPVSVIADIDVLREEDTFKKIFEKLGGVWATVSSEWAALKKSIEERRPPLNAEQVAKMISDELVSVGGIKEFPKAVEAKIKRIFKSISPWDDVKRAGRAAISPGQATKQFDYLSEKCGSVGLWIVPVGELEGFCRSIEGGHGPGFVTSVLEERSLETDEELEEARKFVSKIWQRARPSASVAAQTAEEPTRSEGVAG